MSFNVHFTSYPELINLFEEIFIYQTYKFTSDDPHPVIIDCGSNIGLSVMYFKMTTPSSVVLAFEPDGETFGLLTKNIRENDLKNVSLYNFALRDFETETTLYKNNQSLTSSLYNNPGKQKEEIVLTKKLSSYIEKKVKLIKIDVEGSELAIIDDIISSNKVELVEKLIIEYHPVITRVPAEEIMSRLRVNNFKCELIPDQLHPGATEVMLYCERS